MSWLALVIRGVTSRRLASTLTTLSVALGVALVVALLLLARDTRDHYLEPGRGYGLVVGAPGSRLQLVMSTVLHKDQAPGLLSVERYRELQQHRSARLAVPYAVGDSFQGYPVVGTSPAFFDPTFPYPAGKSSQDKLSHGRPFKFSEKALDQSLAALTGSPETHDDGETSVFEAVIGSQVAEELGVRVGDRIEPTHGVEGAKAHEHEQLWTVVGVLRASGTSVDRLVLINLDSFYRIPDHSGGILPDSGEPGLSAVLLWPRPGAHKALLLGELAKRGDLTVADVDEELRSLMSLVGNVDRLLLIVASLVILVSLLGVVVSLYGSLATRRRELAVLRALGMAQRSLLSLMIGEALVLGLTGAGLGALLGHILLAALGPHVSAAAGFAPDPTRILLSEAYVVLAVAAAATLAGLIPGLSAYRVQVSEQLDREG